MNRQRPLERLATSVHDWAGFCVDSAEMVVTMLAMEAYLRCRVGARSLASRYRKTRVP